MTDRKALPPFAALRAFEAVGRLGGIRKAAAELSIDHASVSRHLRALEGWLGAPLFDRSASSPRLNAAGRHYHEAIGAALTEIARATRQVVAQQSGDRLLIWCVPGLASRWLAPRLDAFLELNPRLDVELRPTDRRPDFHADEADCDLRFVRDFPGEEGAPGTTRLTLSRPPMFPVASPEWIANNPTSGRPGDFLHLRLLHEDTDDEWRAWFSAHLVPVRAPLPGPRLWHAHMTLDAARRGQGVALANALLVADDLAAGRLRPVTDTYGNAPAVEIGAYVFSCRTDDVARPAMAKLRDWIEAQASSFLQESNGAITAS